MNLTKFYQLLLAAIRDMAAYGFDSEKRLEDWSRKLRDAATASMAPENEIVREVSQHLETLYTRSVIKKGVLKGMPLNEALLIRLQPELRRELNRRIMASANLIKLNRVNAIDRTIQRFNGWATSVPAGGSRVVESRKESDNIKKPLASLPFEERRVAIDQGHKLVSNIREVVATAGGAIAGEWQSHWRQPGYNYRKDHKERDKKVYAIRGNWELDNGYMKAGPDGYTDEITEPGEEVFCRCNYRYIFHLRDLPESMLTQKGKDSLAAIAEKRKALLA